MAETEEKLTYFNVKEEKNDIDDEKKSISEIKQYTKRIRRKKFINKMESKVKSELTILPILLIFSCWNTITGILYTYYSYIQYSNGYYYKIANYSLFIFIFVLIMQVISFAGFLILLYKIGKKGLKIKKYFDLQGKAD